MYPNLEFRLNKELDKKMIPMFLNFAGGGIDFGAGILRDHPNLRGDGVLLEDVVGNYCDEFYKGNLNALNDKLREFREIWGPLQDSFFERVLELFGSCGFPDGKYHAYLSIIDCNPRFLSDCTFQIYWQRSDPVRVISHELMHFSFFHYCKERLGKLFAGDSPDGDGPLWALSELFNNIILNDQEMFADLTGASETPYPNHADYFRELQLIWDDKKNVELFIPQAYCRLKEMNSDWRA